jgi:glucan endo-1,3-beta-D-glucosidase
MRYSSVLAASSLAMGASAQNYLGFNTGSTFVDRSAKMKSDFEAEFTAAQGLENAPGVFNAVRLYTNIQAYTQDDPISAFEAAINTNTSILLGVWTSGTDSISKEITALKKAVDQFGTKFTDRVIGISIGSEDLYRISATGIENKSGPGASPTVLVQFIKDFKSAFANTPLSSTPVGHVDTWDVWGNATNKPVLDAIDFIGVDEYPYYENGKGNEITNSGQLFDRAYDATLAAAGGKPVWVTETGWPVTGPNWDKAVPSAENAKYFWNEVGCRRLFNKTPTFWYNLRDSNPDNEAKFAISDNLATKPYFDLSCPTTFKTPSTTGSTGSSSSVTSGTARPTSTTGTNGGSGAGTPGTTGAGSGSTTPTPSTTTRPNAGSVSMDRYSSGAYFGLAMVAGVFAMF